ncbi:hypothetical protein [Desulfobulbus alkaliphilus]|uniref:hypothetical protein n=1 Tax=Desulfobulbus alkaliphilus TaxID=869814 RepID=UPI0019630AB7|nr:hypothetical protein [Desulfobulbus alkaliphilus]MBM9537710.1 hypothetical protein [Desulfobulbus alkaliphilus]
MKTTKRSHSLSAPYHLGALGALAVLFCLLAVRPVAAGNEFRVGAVLQVPFSISGSGVAFNQSGIRLGLTGQYADIDDDTIIINRFIDNQPETDGRLTRQVVTRETVKKDEGNRVIGLEANLFFEIFNNWNGTVELLGFYGTNDVQGALGAGYSFTHDLFVVGKLMFPYSEVGLRYMYLPEIFFGVKTLGSFSPDTTTYINEIITNK